MQDFKKRVSPGFEGKPGPRNRITCDIELKNGRLSISGAGDGFAGQINDTIRDVYRAGNFTLADDWSEETLFTFLDHWDRWHLNDMRATCEHQRANGWEALARENITMYHWTLKTEWSQKQKALENEAVERAKSVPVGRSVGFSDHERKILNLPYEIQTESPELSGDNARYYGKPFTGSHVQHIETKTRGWIDHAKDERGILSKPCEVCGYKYGSAWNLEELPEEVAEFMRSLPKN